MGFGGEGSVREFALVAKVAGFGVEELAWKFAVVVRTLLALGTVVQEKELANLLLLFPGSCDVAEQAVDSVFTEA